MSNFILNSLLEILKDGFIFGLIGFVISFITIPLIFLKTHRQQTGSNYTKIFQEKITQSGWLVFYSGALPYAILNFISSACFGISESISVPILQKFDLAYQPIGIIIRTIFLGFTETLLIIYFDLKTISKQKKEFLLQKPNILSIALPSFLRNTVIWGGATSSIYVIYYLTNNAQFLTITYSLKIIISFILGISFAILALPFDLVSTQVVGCNKKISLIKRLKENIKEHGIIRLCHGGLVRVIVLGIFTVATVLTDLFLNQR